MKKYLILFALLTIQIASGYSQGSSNIQSDSSLLKEFEGKKNVNENTFLETLNAQLNAIQNRDLDGYVKTISQKSDIIMILASGKILNNRDSIIAMHKEWFASKTWSLKCTIDHTVVKKEFGIALLTFNYHDIDEHGKPYDVNNLLSLIFENQDGTWRLIYDQNTRNPLKHSLKK
ncbi:MAG: hypothetical protein EHM93_17515 [Bacteroidales bacterium]|nr:MAG: hypothetical protein EHM93_17515 [Bacteroidales bacterium]